MRKRILFIGTGGTIASDLTKGALSPSLGASELLRLVPDVSKICDIEAEQLFALDSTDIMPEHWLALAALIHEKYDMFDGFVIAHGTDTLAYTASALSYLIQNSRKPVVITGAQKPIGFETTDSKQNLSDAFRVAASDMRGVLVVFGGTVLLTVFFEPKAGEERFYSRLDSSVGLLKLTPATDAELLRFMLDRYDALVIESFGVGGLPDRDGDFRREAERAVKNGKTVVVTTLVQSEGTDLSVYNVGSDLAALGVLEAFDMTPEACFTKLMWLLPLTDDPTERERLFYTPVSHDILPPQEIAVN